jgi:DNA-directed RNA polymerase specialized sigma subunit
VANLSLNEAVVVGAGNFEPLLELDTAMQRLEAFDSRKSHMVELFYYGGLTQEEIGRVLDLSSITVLRELKLARAWLHSQLSIAG